MSTKPDFSSSDVADWLRTKWPGATASKVHTEGMESQVFAFSSGDQAYVLRLNESDFGFRKDRYFLENFGESIPIPDVIETGPFGDAFYCVSAFVEGLTVQDLPTEQLPAFAPRVCEIWEKISSLEVSAKRGFGVLDTDGAAPYPTWRDTLLNSVSDEDIAEAQRIVSSETFSDLKQAFDRYRSLIDSCPEERRLFHGDFGSNNLIASDDAVIAVIDWDSAAIGDPLIDVANAYYWSFHLDCMRVQAAYFEEHLSHLPNYRTRIACYQLKIGIEEVIEAIRDGDDANEVELLVGRLNPSI